MLSPLSSPITTPGTWAVVNIEAALVVRDRSQELSPLGYCQNAHVLHLPDHSVRVLFLPRPSQLLHHRPPGDMIHHRPRLCQFPHHPLSLRELSGHGERADERVAGRLRGRHPFGPHFVEQLPGVVGPALRAEPVHEVAVGEGVRLAPVVGRHLVEDAQRVVEVQRLRVAPDEDVEGPGVGRDPLLQHLPEQRGDGVHVHVVDHGVVAPAREQRGEERVVGVGGGAGGRVGGGAHEGIDVERLAGLAELAVEVERGAEEGPRGGEGREEGEEERAGAVELVVEGGGAEALDGDEEWRGIGPEGGQAEGVGEEREEEAEVGGGGEGGREESRGEAGGEGGDCRGDGVGGGRRAGRAVAAAEAVRSATGGGEGEMVGEGGAGGRSAEDAAEEGDHRGGGGRIWAARILGTASTVPMTHKPQRPNIIPPG